ncbi:MAG: pyrroline-5-carboxylate reductase [Flavisolibacter sp.]|jgi:pyrroline-5-carboxylate reductase|nr:pyrroline-5-carboxylate reductase [Flavisolibacter sp.]
MDQKITIIGAGNLGSAIAKGLLINGFIKPDQLVITRRNTFLLSQLADLGVKVTSNNTEAAEASDIIILAVKPYNYQDVLEEIKTVVHTKQILISVVTGVWLNDLENIIKKNTALFRAMPNTAIAIQQSMTCLCYKNASLQQIDTVQKIFNQVGRTVTIDENLMDAATVLGACGTAYAMRYIRANIQGGIEIGFDVETASLIAAQTVKGASQLLLETDSHPEKEIDKVTTPKGCTIAGLNEMEHQGFSSSLIKGIVASYIKIGT